MKLRPSAVALATAAVLVVPGIAQAKTKSVNMGPGPKAKLAENVDVNAFFPKSTTIRVGDKVKFVPLGFHNVDLPAKGDAVTDLLTPTGTNASGVNDAAGTPFWFNGQPNIGFNPALVTSSGFGKKFSYNGKKGVQSGLPLAAKPKPMTVTFKKKGKFTYYCGVHPGMKGTVSVKGKKAKVPSKKADKKRVAKQIATAVKTSKTLATSTPPANTIDVGVAGKHGEEFFDFVPKTKTVPVGTTVTFRMSPASYEVHTATAGPGDPGKPDPSYLREIAASFEGAPQLDPRGVYPSDVGPPVGLTKSTHGNGFWNSGALDTVAASPLPASSQVTFSEAGTYDFYCLVHPFMKGTVTAQ